MPFQLIGRLLGVPAYRDKTTALVVTAQETLYKTILVFLTFTAILWMSIFLYASFYYTYIPAIAHIRPVHLQFSSCGKEHGLCNFPSANVTLTRRQKLLMVGQPYRILVEMEMPESKANQKLGMFMVCADLKSSEYTTVGKSCRSAILHYKSFVHQAVATLIFSPFLLSGSAEEKQLVSVELFSGFQEDPTRPATEAFVEIQSQHVEIYHAHLKIHARFTGLRYFMFHWPILAAFLGITINYIFLAIIAFLSWYKFYNPTQIIVHAGYDANAARSIEESRAAAKERLLAREQTEGHSNSEGTITNNENDSSEKEIAYDKSKLEENPEEIINPDHKNKVADEKFEEAKDTDDSSETSIENKLDKNVEHRNSDEFEVISHVEDLKAKEMDNVATKEDEKENCPYQEESVKESTNFRQRKQKSSK